MQCAWRPHSCSFGLVFACLFITALCAKRVAAYACGGRRSCSIVVGCLPGSQADRERVSAQLPTGFEIVQKVWDGVPWP